MKTSDALAVGRALWLLDTAVGVLQVLALALAALVLWCAWRWRSARW